MKFFQILSLTPFLWSSASAISQGPTSKTLCQDSWFDISNLSLSSYTEMLRYSDCNHYSLPLTIALFSVALSVILIPFFNKHKSILYLVLILLIGAICYIFLFLLGFRVTFKSSAGFILNN